MTSLADRLRKAVELPNYTDSFEEYASRFCDKRRIQHMWATMFYEGAERENGRLKLIHKRLIECVEAIQKIQKNISLNLIHESDEVSMECMQYKLWLDETLEALNKEVEKV